MGRRFLLVGARKTSHARGSFVSDSVLFCSGKDFADLADDLLGSGCQFRFCARGMSMHPFIQDGDVLLVEPLGGRIPIIGDVLLCRGHRGNVYAHRLLHSVPSYGDGDLIVTKGDNSRHSDRAIDFRNVLGRVVAIENGARRISLGAFHVQVLVWVWSRMSPWSARLRIRFRRHRWLFRLVPRP